MSQYMFYFVALEKYIFSMTNILNKAINAHFSYFLAFSDNKPAPQQGSQHLELG